MTMENQANGPEQAPVDSLLKSMEPGREYGSIVAKMPVQELDLVTEVINGLNEIEQIRRRPCLLYVGDVIRGGEAAGIDAADDLPFAEMVSLVEAGKRSADVFVATNGGSAHQVSRFVNSLRARFESVDFLVPSFCMSAGTIMVLSGNEIWMTPRACLGPIDPQVPSSSGRFVPAQALILLVDQLQKQGDQALANGRAVPWTLVRIIDTLDKSELASAITSSNYSITMAAEFLENYKFRSWTVTESQKLVVTAEKRRERALEIAGALASHDRWKSHGHAIPREVLWQKIKLQIRHPENDLEQAMTRLWALLTWIFDKTPVEKLIVSKNYRFLRQKVLIQGAQR